MSASQRALERALGLWALAFGRARAQMLRLRGARVGQKTVVGPGCRIVRPWGVSVGRRAALEACVYLKLVDDDALLEIGDHVYLGTGVVLDVMGRVAVGPHTLIAPGCFITDHNHGIQPGRFIDQQPCGIGPVTIGEDVWLGAQVIILPGVSIGDGAVVGAGAVVTGDVPPGAIAVGVPARVRGSRGGPDR